MSNSCIGCLIYGHAIEDNHHTHESSRAAMVDCGG